MMLKLDIWATNDKLLSLNGNDQTSIRLRQIHGEKVAYKIQILIMAFLCFTNPAPGEK